MRNCDYYERLISDRLDEPLDLGSETDLCAHLELCRSCRDFLSQAMNQRRQLLSLPDFDADLPLQQPAKFAEKLPEIVHIWQRRLSLPLPVAAAMLLLMLTGWFLALGGRIKQDQLPLATPFQVSSVEIIRVEPARAVQVETRDKQSNEKESKL